METVFFVIYSASVGGCAYLVMLCADDVKQNPYDPYFDIWLIPSIAALSVVPVINTLICVVLGLHVAQRAEERKKRDAEIKARMEDPDSSFNRWIALINECDWLDESKSRQGAEPKR